MTTISKQELLQQLKQRLIAIEPEAKLLLYGSRARGDAEPDSDWDILVLVDGEVTDERKQRIRHALYEVELESGEVISVIVRNNDDWTSPLSKATPYYWNVSREAITL